jgi:hypothetical protein
MITQYNLYNGRGISTQIINDKVLTQLNEKGHQITHNTVRPNLISRIQSLILPKELRMGSFTYVIESQKKDSKYKTVISPGFDRGALKIISNESLSTIPQDYNFPENITKKQFCGEKY